MWKFKIENDDLGAFAGKIHEAGRNIRTPYKKCINENKEREKYLIVCTGNQGEPNAILSRIARDELPFKLNSGDHVVFSCRTIPTPETTENRRMLEERLRKKGVIMFKDIHQSGHASREDLRHLIEMVNPKHIIPAHGGGAGNKGLANLAVEMGYKLGETVHLVKDGSVLEV